MKRLILLVGVAAAYLLTAQILLVAADETQPIVRVEGRTIVAFFPPVSHTKMQKDADANEALADFQFYATRVREPLRKAGIDFHEVHAHSFRVRVGKTVTAFRPVKGDVGYYLVVPGKKPRIKYGVMTDADLFQVSNEYFGQGGQVRNDEVRLRATVEAIVPLTDFSGVITPVEVDPRFALTLRIEAVAPAVHDFGAGDVIILGVHSPSQLFPEESAKGKTYDFLLRRGVEEGKLKCLGIEVRGVAR